jgi:hypothetical protein
LLEPARITLQRLDAFEQRARACDRGRASCAAQLSGQVPGMALQSLRTRRVRSIPRNLIRYRLERLRSLSEQAIDSLPFGMGADSAFPRHSARLPSSSGRRDALSTRRVLGVAGDALMARRLGPKLPRYRERGLAFEQHSVNLLSGGVATH